MIEAIRFFLRVGLLPVRACGIRLPHVVYKHLYRRGDFLVQMPFPGPPVRLCSWGDSVENDLFWIGWRGHEADVRATWFAAARHASFILDIGANTGTFSFFAKGVNGSAVVHAFEPLARVAERIRRNVAVSGLDVDVYECAVSLECGDAELYDPGGDNAYSASLDAEFLPGMKEVVKVPVVSIDAHAAAVGLSPDLIKIDVEGVEVDVLLGARNVLSQSRPIVVCEWLLDSAGHQEVQCMLVDLGYVFLKPESLEELDVLQAGRKSGLHNVVMCPREKVNQLKEWHAELSSTA